MNVEVQYTHVIRREDGEIQFPNGNVMLFGGRWVLRDRAGNFLEVFREYEEMKSRWESRGAIVFVDHGNAGLKPKRKR